MHQTSKTGGLDAGREAHLGVLMKRRWEHGSSRSLWKERGGARKEGSEVEHEKAQHPLAWLSAHSCDPKCCDNGLLLSNSLTVVVVVWLKCSSDETAFFFKARLLLSLMSILQKIRLEAGGPSREGRTAHEHKKCKKGKRDREGDPVKALQQQAHAPNLSPVHPLPR